MDLSLPGTYLKNGELAPDRSTLHDSPWATPTEPRQMPAQEDLGRPLTLPHTLPDDELLAQCRVETFRSGGAGGQHQNVTESGVRLTHRPTGVSAIARDDRSQARNRRIALGRLRKRLEERSFVPVTRVATQVPRRERARRRREKQHRSELKEQRRSGRDRGGPKDSNE